MSLGGAPRALGSGGESDDGEKRHGDAKDHVGNVQPFFDDVRFSKRVAFIRGFRIVSIMVMASSKLSQHFA